MRRGDYFFGGILIFIGILFLLNNFEIIQLDINPAEHWPLVFIIPGVLFELGFFIRRKDAGLLVPGGILLTYGVLFYINVLYGWDWVNQLWPLFPMGVAFGLLQLYVFGGRDRALLIPVGIIGGFSLIALSFTLEILDSGILIGAAFILLGLIFLFRRK